MRNLASAAAATATAGQLAVMALFVLLALVALALVLDGRWELRLPPAPRLPIIIGAGNRAVGGTATSRCSARTCGGCSSARVTVSSVKKGHHLGAFSALRG